MGHSSEIDSGQPRTARISFSDGHEEDLTILPIGGNKFRLEESSLLGEATYRDIIEAELQPDGSLRFLRLVAPSGLKTVSCVLSDVQFKSQRLCALLETITAAGGGWERVFGGVLILHVPTADETFVLNSLREVSENP